MYKTRHEVSDESACQVCFQIGAQSEEITVMSMLFIDIIRNPFYDTLRTKFVYFCTLKGFNFNVVAMNLQADSLTLLIHIILLLPFNVGWFVLL